MKLFVVLLICLTWLNITSATTDNVEVINKIIEKLPTNLQNGEPSIDLGQLILQRALRSISDDDQITVLINKYFDQVLKAVRRWLIKKDLDPLPLEDISKSFDKKIGFIDFTGFLNLTNGHVTGISEVKRGNDSYMIFEKGFLNFRIPLTFETLKFQFDFAAGISIFSESGSLDGHADSIDIEVDFVVDTDTTEVTLETFEIRHLGDLKIEFHGNNFIDWLEDILSDIVTTVFHDLITGVIQNNVQTVVQQAIDDFNNKPK